jgi:hypothetical protein
MRWLAGLAALATVTSSCSRPPDAPGLSAYGVSGAVTGPFNGSVTLNLAGARSGTTTTDASGKYLFSGLPLGDYTVTPSLAGYTFSPASATVTLSGSEVAQDFTANAPWVPVTSGTANFLEGVWGTAANDVWAVGPNGTILHWNGTGWESVTNPLDGLTNGPYALWGTGPRNVFAVGNIGGNATTGSVLWWNGTWSRVAGAYPTLGDVWGSADAADVWAVGTADAAGTAGTIVHRNASAAWSSVTIGTARLYGVWGSAASDVWATGASGTILHWDGDAWSPVASGATGTLLGVWGSSASDVWVVGSAGTILHWNGTAWSGVESGTTQNLYRAWGSAANDVWAVGYAGTIVHWDGAAWSSFASGTDSLLHGVWGSGAGDVWAVGELGTILHHQQ